MPMIYRQGPYRFYFFSHEPTEIARIVRVEQEAWYGYFGDQRR